MRLTKLNTKNFDEFKILLLNGKTNLSELFRVINVFRLKNQLPFFQIFHGTLWHATQCPSFFSRHSGIFSAH